MKRIILIALLIAITFAVSAKKKKVYTDSSLSYETNVICNNGHQAFVSVIEWHPITVRTYYLTLKRLKTTKMKYKTFLKYIDGKDFQYRTVRKVGKKYYKAFSKKSQ